jgi:hypothetical protein
MLVLLQELHRLARTVMRIWTRIGVAAAAACFSVGIVESPARAAEIALVTTILYATGLATVAKAPEAAAALAKAARRRRA